MNLSEKYYILLFHRRETFEAYVMEYIDLVLSGHAYGGQFRLPFIGGVVAPNQGLFLKYDADIHVKNNTTMIVSRRIGNSIIPVRFNNRPEIVAVEMKMNNGYRLQQSLTCTIIRYIFCQLSSCNER